MEVEVRTQLLVPGVKHKRKADFSTEFATPKIQKGSRGRIKQQFEQLTLIRFTCQNPSIELVWQCEHLMEVGNGQQFKLASFTPRFLGLSLAFGTVSVSATVINETFKVARSAARPVSAECRGPAVHHRTQHFEVPPGDSMSLQKLVAVS